MEQFFDIIPKEVKYQCDNCKEGEMVYKGNMLMTNPPQFTHECSYCKTEQVFYEKYPTIKWVYPTEEV